MRLFFILTILWAVSPLCADDALSTLSTAGSPGAPVDAEAAKKDPYIALTPGQQKDIVREFRALLSMGKQEATSTHWGGNDIADCQSPESSQESYCRKCDVQMGNTRADYFFYKTGSQCRLRDIDVTVDSADKTLLKQLKPAARDYAGPRNGQFYIDDDASVGQEKLRFIWKHPA